MLERGLWTGRGVRPRRGARGARAGTDPGVIWFTLWTSTVSTWLAVLLGLPAAYVLHRLAIPMRGAVRAALLVPFVLPTVVVGIAIRELVAESGPLGFLDIDGTPVAILIGLVFFNVAVVIRTVGTAWETLDRRPAEAAAALGASPRQVLTTVTLPGSAARDRLRSGSRVPVLRDRVRRRAACSAAPATPRSRPRSTCSRPAPSPAPSSTRQQPRSRSCSWLRSSYSSASRPGCARYRTRPYGERRPSRSGRGGTTFPRWSRPGWWSSRSQRRWPPWSSARYGATGRGPWCTTARSRAVATTRAGPVWVAACSACR